jgi:hypothetical protein
MENDDLKKKEKFYEYLRKYRETEKGRQKTREIALAHYYKKKAEREAYNESHPQEQVDKTERKYYTTNQCGKVYEIKPETVERNRERARQRYWAKKNASE